MLASIKPSNLRRIAALSIVLIGASALLELGIEQLTVNPVWRGRLVIWILFAQAGALVVLAVRAAHLLSLVRSQHRASTYVSTIEGFWDTLAIGAQSGGLPVEVRMKIYEAGKQQFEWYHEAMGDDQRKTQIFMREAPEVDALPTASPA